MINRPMAKQAAHNCMRSARANPMMLGAILLVISSLMSVFDTLMLTEFGSPMYYYNMAFMGPSAINIFIGIMIILISSILQAGFTYFCLEIRHGKEMPVKTLFDGFSQAGRIIVLQVVTSVFIYLWAMLFIIPGIIAYYRYRFALFNLMENPDISPMEAIRMSKEQTMGYKMELFMLDLSFLGWFLLNIFTMSILSIWLAPYYTLTCIAYYDHIRAEKGMIHSSDSPISGSSDSPRYTSYREVDENSSSPGYDYDWNSSQNKWEDKSSDDQSDSNQKDS